MNSDMNDELKSFCDLAEKFAQKELEAEILDLERYPFVPFKQDIWNKAVETGLATISLPESFGGSGQGIAALGAILERVARVDAGVAALLLSQALAQAVVAQAADQATAKKILDGSNMPVIAVPMYDLPDDLRTEIVAKKEGEGYRLDGWAPYLAAAPIAGVYIVPASMADGRGPALFVLDKEMKGVTVGEPAVNLGLRMLPMADVGCDGVAVGANRMLDMSKYEPTVDRFRAPVASLALGLVTGSYQTALDYAQERYQAKKHIIEHDQVRMMLSGMASLIDVGSTAIPRECSRADSGIDAAASLSLQAGFTKSAALACTDGVQLLGGYGYMHDYGQEKRMRDAKQLQAVFGPAAVKSMDVLSMKIGKPRE